MAIRKNTLGATAPKNISEYMAMNAKNTYIAGAPKKTTQTKSKQSHDDSLKEIENLLKTSGDTVWVENISGAEFHVPMSLDPKDEKNAIRFKLNEINYFDPSDLKNRYFRDSLMNGKLKIVKATDVEMLRKMQEQEAAKDASNQYGGSGDSGGLAESGLPLNKKMAKRYIDDTDDLDLLDSWAQKENRDNIIDYIDERIEDIENGEG